MEKNIEYYDTNCDFPIQKPVENCEFCGKILQENERKICDLCKDELMGRDQSKLKF